MIVLSGEARFPVRTFDISAGGLGIVASANPRTGTGLEVDFSVPLRPKGSTPLRLSAKVAHSVLAGSEGGFKIGLVFTDLPKEAAQAIMDYIM